MITFIKQNKTLTIVAVLVIFGIALYSFSSSGGSPSSGALLASSNAADSVASQQLLVTLANLHTIRLDGSIFSDPVYLSLSDYGVVISPESVGRRNPFAPFSGTSTPQVNVSTIGKTHLPGSASATNPPITRTRVFPVSQ